MLKQDAGQVEEAASSQKVGADEDVVSLNADDLTIEELEQRLELAGDCSCYWNFGCNEENDGGSGGGGGGGGGGDDDDDDDGGHGEGG